MNSSSIRIPSGPLGVLHMQIILRCAHLDLRVQHIGKLSGILRYDYEPGHLTVFCVVK